MWVLAWRNLWRQRNRSLVTLGVVALVVTTTLLFFALGEAFKNGMFQVLTDEAGHLAVTSASARQAREFDALLIRDAAQVEQIVRDEVGEGGLAVLLEIPALASSGNRSRGVQVVGMRQSEELRRRFNEEYLTEGRLPAPGSFDEIVLGRALARALRVEPGDVVYLFAPGTEGIGAAAYTLVGLLDFTVSSLEARVAYVSLEAAQELAAPGAATRFQVHLPGLRRLSDEGQVLQVRDRLAARVGAEVRVEGWREADPSVANLLDVIDPMMLVMNLLGFILAGLLVVNTVYLSLVERIREFGVIIAVGADRWKVMRMVIAESLVLVGAGSALGGGVGLAVIARLARGFSFPLGLAETYAEFGIPTVMYAGLSLEQFLVTVALAVGTALAAALWPAWLAGRLQPVEAMRYVA